MSIIQRESSSYGYFDEFREKRKQIFFKIYERKKSEIMQVTSFFCVYKFWKKI